MFRVSEVRWREVKRRHRRMACRLQSHGEERGSAGGFLGQPPPSPGWFGSWVGVAQGLAGGLGEGHDPWLSKLAVRAFHCGEKQTQTAQTDGGYDAVGAFHIGVFIPSVFYIS